MKEKKKYWYKTTIYYCPICCRENVYKERQYTEKPKEYEKRVKIIEVWDYCGAF